MKDNISINRGSIVTFEHNGRVQTGVVHDIFRHKTEGPLRSKYENIYVIADTGEAIPKSAIISFTDKSELRPNILKAIFGEDVLDNLQAAQSATADYNDRHSHGKYARNPRGGENQNGTGTD